MMLQKKSPRRSFMKLLALVPIICVALALNAETVNDYVYQQPPKKIVKKGKKDATVKVGNETIQVVGDTASAAQAKTIEELVVYKATAPEKQPIYILDGGRIDLETFNHIDPKEIASVTVLKDQPAVDQYGEEARDGVIIITLKKEVEEVFTPVERDPEFFDVVEQMPEFPGGANALFEYLAKNIHYPKEAAEKKIQGRVILTFVVEKDGSISRVKVVKSVEASLDQEAIRVVKSMPKWTPGKQNGKNVAVKYTIPMTFRL